ncbi:hypothetical protein [Lacticaseibacillus sp. 866-1]|nr:hypothetical protein [Lacticaseibacillus sp. 866-1]
MALLVWILEHQLTIAALVLASLLAFVIGQFVQFCEDDKKAAKRDNA